MKDNPKILMVVTTEFGLMTALLYYFLYQEKKLFPHFILLKNKKERFSGLNLDALPGSYDLYNDELNTRVHHPDVAFKSILSENNVKEILFQNPQNFITNKIINTYKIANKDLNLTMLSDGLLLLSKMGFKNKIIANVKLYYRKLINKCTNLPNYVLDYCDYVPLVDRLIAHSDVGAKEFIFTGDLIKYLDDFKERMNSIFCIDTDMYDEAEVIFFTQPIISNRFSKEVKENYINLLHDMALFVQKYNIRMLIKVHPEENINMYKRFENTFVVIDHNKNVPSEIVLNGLRDKIVLSMFSSVSLNDQGKYLKHFWLYKIINHNLKINKKIPHITVLLDKRGLFLLLKNANSAKQINNINKLGEYNVF